MVVRRSLHNRRLPRHLFEEYRAFVDSNPEIPPGKTYLQMFLRKKGMQQERQQTLNEVT